MKKKRAFKKNLKKTITTVTAAGLLVTGVSPSFAEAAESVLETREPAAKEKVEGLFTNNKYDIIKDTTSQKAIDEAKADVKQLPPGAEKDRLQGLVDKAQDLLLKKKLSIKNIDYKLQNLTIAFNTEDFKNYRIFLKKNGKYFSELDKGKNYYSTLSGLNWINSGVSVNNDDLFEVEVIFPDKNYILYSTKGSSLKEISLQKELNDLYENGSIKETVDQKKLDQLKADVKQLPPGAEKDRLQGLVDKAQDLLNKKNEAGQALAVAKEKVEGLFTDNKFDTIKDTTNQKAIDEAKADVKQLP
ncbi:hypothetical protein EKA14_27690, partial [Bacillus mycoides]